MDTQKIDRLNTLLIFISFATAFFLPFQLFLFAYATLGPLHYITELNWIKEKNYFTTSKYWKIIIVFFSVLISLPALIKLLEIDLITEYNLFKILKYKLPLYTNHLFFLAFVIALSLIITKKKTLQIIIISCGILFTILAHQFNTYQMCIGILLPTIVHVYFFTFLFMWYGNKKNEGSTNFLNIILLISVPILLFFLDIDNSNYSISDKTQNIFTSNYFYQLNNSISKIISFGKDEQFFFYDIIDLKIQIFIAFAYTYHYLNWFSKTNIIGWNKKLTLRKTILFLFIWIVSITLYFIDYSLGLIILLFLSTLHVLFEFPLNIITIKALIKK